MTKGILIIKIEAEMLIGKMQQPKTQIDQKNDIFPFNNFAFKVTTTAF